MKDRTYKQPNWHVFDLQAPCDRRNMLNLKCQSRIAGNRLQNIPKELTIDPFDAVKSGHSGRRGAQHDAVHRASAATHQMGGFGAPEAGFSRSPDVVMLHLWSTRPRREACLASKREKSVKWVNSQFLWYNLPRPHQDLNHLGNMGSYAPLCYGTLQTIRSMVSGCSNQKPY